MHRIKEFNDSKNDMNVIECIVRLYPAGIDKKNSNKLFTKHDTRTCSRKEMWTTLGNKKTVKEAWEVVIMTLRLGDEWFTTKFHRCLNLVSLPESSSLSSVQ